MMKEFPLSPLIGLVLIAVIVVYSMFGQRIESWLQERKLRKLGCSPVREIVMKHMDGPWRGKWLTLDMIHAARCEHHIEPGYWSQWERGTEHELDKLVAKGLLRSRKECRQSPDGYPIYHAEYCYPKTELSLVFQKRA